MRAGLETARSTVVRLYCRLVTKYVAYFSSRSSPVFQKNEVTGTRDLLLSGEQLQFEQANILLRREAFCEYSPTNYVELNDRRPRHLRSYLA